MLRYSKSKINTCLSIITKWSTNWYVNVIKKLNLAGKENRATKITRLFRSEKRKQRKEFEVLFPLKNEACNLTGNNNFLNWTIVGRDHDQARQTMTI